MAPAAAEAAGARVGGTHRVLFALEQGRSYYALPAMLPALVAGCLALAARRPRRSTLLAFGGLHLAVLVIALPLVVPILPTRQLVSTGTWNLSFWKDELGWRELTAQTARAWSSRTPAQRAAGAIVAGNYGVAGALALYGPAAGLPAPVSGHLSYQYWHPSDAVSAALHRTGSASTARERPRAAAKRRCSPSSTTAGTSTTRSGGGRSSGAACARLSRPDVWQQSFANAAL